MSKKNIILIAIGTTAVLGGVLTYIFKGTEIKDRLGTERHKLVQKCDDLGLYI